MQGLLFQCYINGRLLQWIIIGLQLSFINDAENIRGEIITSEIITGKIIAGEITGEPTSK